VRPRASTTRAERAILETRGEHAVTELDADFDVDAFEPVAFDDHDREWIEMRLPDLLALSPSASG
jgi:uncharacterized SAM-dependent methyltransferase